MPHLKIEGPFMRILAAAALAISVSGCAMFQTADTRAALAPQPAVKPAVATPARFTPAFGAGAPVALVPCRTQMALGSECRGATVSHERRGDMPAGENSETFSDATTVSLTTE
jgi:hypothetical protein